MPDSECATGSTADSDRCLLDTSVFARNMKPSSVASIGLMFGQFMARSNDAPHSSWMNSSYYSAMSGVTLITGQEPLAAAL